MILLVIGVIGLLIGLSGIGGYYAFAIPVIAVFLSYRRNAEQSCCPAKRSSAEPCVPIRRRRMR